MYTGPKLNTAILLTLKVSTLNLSNHLNEYEYPISGDALALLTGPAHTQVNIWELVSC